MNSIQTRTERYSNQATLRRPSEGLRLWLFALTVSLLLMTPSGKAQQSGEPTFYCASGVRDVAPGAIVYCNLADIATIGAVLVESANVASVYLLAIDGLTCQVDGFYNSSWRGTIRATNQQNGEPLCFRNVNSPTRPCLKTAINAVEIYCY